MIENIIQGTRSFYQKVQQNKKLFESASEKQEPQVAFITCSDSRIRSHDILQACLGEVFVIRNAGNIIPPFGSESGGVVASIEFAVQVLGVKHLIVCGHSNCGAIKAIREPELFQPLSNNIAQWTNHARSETVVNAGSLEEASQQNVLLQLKNIETYPSVSEALKNKLLELHAWYYDISSGKVYIYDFSKEQFVF